MNHHVRPYIMSFAVLLFISVLLLLLPCALSLDRFLSTLAHFALSVTAI